MTHGQHYSKYQQKVIGRFYEHADTRLVTQLQELVSEIYLATDAKAQTKLWTRADQLLAKAGANLPRHQKIIETRDAKGLAEVVGEIAGKK